MGALFITFCFVAGLFMAISGLVRAFTSVGDEVTYGGVQFSLGFSVMVWTASVTLLLFI